MVWLGPLLGHRHPKVAATKVGNLPYFQPVRRLKVKMLLKIFALASIGEKVNPQWNVLKLLSKILRHYVLAHF